METIETAKVEPKKVFVDNQYLLKRKILAIGDTLRIFDSAGTLVLFSKQKLLRIKEEINIFTDESMQEVAFSIKARQIIDFSAAYDIFDNTDQKIGTLKRRGWQSLARDSWVIMDAEDQEIGKIEEDNMALALVRRFLTNLIPQSFSAFIGDKEVFEIKQRFNPFILSIDLFFKDDNIDKRLGFATAVLSSAIEGRQQ